jgi:hypothetical protein
MGDVLALTKGAVRSRGGVPTTGGQGSPPGSGCGTSSSQTFIEQPRTRGVAEKYFKSLKEQAETMAKLRLPAELIVGLRLEVLEI